MRSPISILATALVTLSTPALAETADTTPQSPFAAPTLIQFDGPTDTTTPALSTQSRATLSGTANWTGFYAGGQIGFANLDTNISNSDDDVIGGLVLGYDYDFGQWVLGGGIDYDFADLDAGGTTTVEEIFRLKLRGGYKIGKGLLYGTGGYANADTNNRGDDDGWFIGGGYDYMISDSFSVGGEVLYHEFDNFNSTGTDIEATTVQVRATFRF
ncbi:porin family protein [Roseovarius sp.]|uniref:outer membrane protein n=1 Tax=Roseovarius sp. TaxID=1486281 RepID=UPI0026196B0C|nr:porin family protein [Roseovarius sp.]